MVSIGICGGRVFHRVDSAILDLRSWTAAHLCRRNVDGIANFDPANRQLHVFQLVDTGSMPDFI
jgi:hypothetical protein